MNRVIRNKLVALLAAVLVVVPLASAGAQETPEPHPEELFSFSESPGCGALDGVRGPLASISGTLPMTEKVYGPWGDFFGRTIQSIYDQTVLVDLPNRTTSALERVHERLLPALDLAIANLEAEQANNGNTYTIRTDTYSWWRVTVPPSRHLSFHAAGTALDINSTTNPYSAENILITDMPEWFVNAWTSAGWCWGGDWQTIKDPMHMSWMGPLHTPGYDMSQYPPQPPLAAYSGYSDHVSSPEVVFDVRFDEPASGPVVVTDLDRDGAVDVVRLRTNGAGQIVLDAAQARNSFHWSDPWAVTTTVPTDPTAFSTLADLTRDGRPDLVYVIDDGGTIDFEVFPLVQGGSLSPLSQSTTVPAATTDVYLFDDFDLDGYTDLFIVRPGAPGTFEVWLGPDFDTQAVSLSATFPADSRYSIDDRDFDGYPDLFSLSTTGFLEIRPGHDPDDAGYVPFSAVGSLQTNLTDTSEALFARDLDGDGHPDLLMVGPDGEMRMRRGGFSSHDPWIWYALRSYEVWRYFGADRYSTATAISAGEYQTPGDVDTVFVASGLGFADALAGAAAAAQIGAPLLLVAPDSIPTSVASELDRLDPSSIVVLGGPAAISEDVQTQLGAWAPTTRLSGDTRYETAVAISEYAFPTTADQVVIATGLGFADALSGAAAAFQFDAPILLTDPGALPADVIAEIQRLDPSRIVVLGGDAAVSPSVFAQLQGLAPETIRISGVDRYDTAIKISQAAFPTGATRVFLATGVNFPDALAGAAAAAFKGIPILLVPGTSVPANVQAEIQRLGTFEVFLLGGGTALSGTVATTVEVIGL